MQRMIKFSWEARPKPTGTKLHCVNFNFIVFFSLISEKLAEYNLGEEIGQGGFGCVFSGTRKVDNLPVSNVREQLTVVSLEYNRGSEDKERQSHFCPCLHDRVPIVFPWFLSG